MIIKTETAFKVTTGEEVIDRYHLTEDQAKKIIEDYLNDQTYTYRKKFLENIGAEKIS